MNKSDIEFTIGLNTSPAEQQLNMFYEKMRTSNKTSPLLQQVADEYSQGFKMVGSAYDSGSNRFGVPSTQVLNTALVATTQTLRKFENALNSVIYMSSRILDDYLKKASQLQIGYTPSSFTEFRSNAYSRLKMTGNPYSTNPNLIGDTYDGYMVGGNNYGVPSTIVNSGGLIRTGRNVSNWSPSEFYTRDQVDAINYNISHNGIFNDLIYKRKTGKLFSETYDIFNQIHSPTGTMGMYNIWSNLFGNKSPIGIEAPKNVWTGVDGSDTPEEQGKDIVEQEKKDNDELKQKLLLWSKIGATIYAIRKALQGLSKLWRLGAENVTSRNTNLNQDLGYFSIDPEGAIRANTDTTRALFYAGIRNMGGNSPISKAGFDYTAQKFTDLWTAAMSGREVDSRTTIDAQRLKEFFGIDLTVAGLLTGQREGKTATDIQLDVMKKVEAQLSKLNEADKTTKGQVIDSLRNILGDEMLNAIVANFNKNSRSDSSLSLAERVMNAGSSTLNGMDLTNKTDLAVTALSHFNDALEELRNSIIVRFSPAFVSLTESITSFVDWLNKKTQIKTVGSSASSTTMGTLSSHNKVVKSTGAGNVLGNKTDRNNVAVELLKSPSVAEDVLNAVSLLNPNVSEATVEEGLQRQFTEEALNALNAGELDPNSKNPLIQKLAKYKYTDKKGNTYYGLEALRMAEKKGVFGKRSKNAWFRNAILGKLQAEPKLEDYQAGGKAGLKNPSAKESEEYFNRAHKAWETSYKAGFTDFYDSDLFAEFAKENFDEGKLFDFDEKTGDIFGYRFNPRNFESADAFYDYIQKTIRIMKETGEGKEYISSIDLPKKEDLWGEDHKLQFEEVVFTIKDTSGNVLDSVRRTPEDVTISAVQ